MTWQNLLCRQKREQTSAFLIEQKIVKVLCASNREEGGEGGGGAEEGDVKRSRDSKGG